MKKSIIASLALASVFAANAATGTVLTQKGFALEPVFSLENLTGAPSTNDIRSAVGVNDKFYVNDFATGLKVYDKEGNLIKTIPATEGYHNWISSSLDQAGHVFVQIDKAVFGSVGGQITANGGHGFMVIDSKTDEVIVPFLEMNSSSQRYDAMGPIAGNILTDEVVSVYEPLNAGTSTMRYLYNARGVEAKPNWWKVQLISTSAGVVPTEEVPSLFTSRAQAQKSTGMAMQYTFTGQENFDIAIFVNPEYKTTYSAEGMFGNAIRKYGVNLKPTDQWFYTPQHSGLTGFNFFTLDGKDYIIYPAGTTNAAADPFAIAEVSYVNSPATDMTMAGETLVDGELAGTLKARVYAATKEDGNPMYAPGNTYTVPSFSVEYIADDPNSVYIYMFSQGAPLTKWKFSVNVPEAPAYTGEGTVEKPYTVADALQLIDKGEMAADNVYTAGVVKSITELSTEYGNATYVIADKDADNELIVFRGKYLDGAKFTSEDQLKVGDEVVVCGKLILYVKGETKTPEIESGNYIYSINGLTEEPGPDFSDCTGTEEASIVINDVDFTFPIFKAEGYGFNTLKADGNNAPVINSGYDTGVKSLRLYASNTITVYGGKLSTIKFVLAADAADKYGTITASTGTVEQAKGDTEFVWTGDATEVKFTVGAKADLSDKPTGAQQLRVASFVINEKPVEEPKEPTVGTIGAVTTQEGFILEPLYTVEGVAAVSNLISPNIRSGVGLNDKVYVNEYGVGVKVYNNVGELIKTIPATEGYHNWVSCNTDQAGHVLVQIDKKAFDGTISADGGHGFMVIDSKTDEVIVPFIAMTSSAQRFDCMSPVQGNILETEKVGIWATLLNGISSFRYLYNNVGAAKPSYWTTKSFFTNAGIVSAEQNPTEVIFPEKANVQTSTGYAMQYTFAGDVNFSVPVYANPYYKVTYSAEGMYGNAIRKYMANYTHSEDGWFYTPQHSGLSGFNFFNIAGKDYIIYPAGEKNTAADAFAIAEVSYVQSPATDMTMAGETLVDGKLAGTLKARVFAATNEAGNPAFGASTAGAPSFVIEPVADDANSVYIYFFNINAPASKWKFTVDPETGVDAVDVVDEADAPAVYYNLQGVRVANPERGLYIKVQGSKSTKIVL
ncbi:MAG: hypothetical protein NC418_07755 [Muribaculaceae bacterium]|nr:hypothetical protein [Muribaculaceae bacterium]